MGRGSDQEPHLQWLIDLHGLYEALSSRSNARARILDAIAAGEMKVIHSAGAELKDAYPELWDEFSKIKVRKYEKPIKKDHELASHLQQVFRASILGGIPTYDQFLSLAMCARLKTRLVTAGNAKKRSLSICRDTKTTLTTVASISDV